MNKLTDMLYEEMAVIWDEAYGPKADFELETVFHMYEELEGYWRDKFTDSSFWFEGYNIICEGLGDAYFMFDTDGPEQNDVIERLCGLVASHPEDKVVKKLINSIREEEIKEDF